MYIRLRLYYISEIELYPILVVPVLDCKIVLVVLILLTPGFRNVRYFGNISFRICDIVGIDFILKVLSRGYNCLFPPCVSVLVIGLLVKVHYNKYYHDPCFGVVIMQRLMSIDYAIDDIIDYIDMIIFTQFESGVIMTLIIIFPD